MAIVEISLPNHPKFTLINLYAPQNNTSKIIIQNVIQSYIDLDTNLMLIGDFNFDPSRDVLRWKWLSETLNSGVLVDMFSLYSVNRSTRMGKNGYRSRIDHLYCSFAISRIFKVNSIDVLPKKQWTDHSPLSFCFKLLLPDQLKSFNSKVPIRKFNEDEIGRLNSHLKDFNDRINRINLQNIQSNIVYQYCDNLIMEINSFTRQLLGCHKHDRIVKSKILAPDQYLNQLSNRINVAALSNKNLGKTLKTYQNPSICVNPLSNADDITKFADSLLGKVKPITVKPVIPSCVNKHKILSR